NPSSVGAGNPALSQTLRIPYPPIMSFWIVSGYLEACPILFDRSQGLFARGVSTSHLRRYRRVCVLQFKNLEHCGFLPSLISTSPHSSINRALERRWDEVRLRNHAFVQFAPVFDPILWSFAFDRSQADDFKVALCRSPRNRWNEINGLPDLEPVGARCHRKYS